MITTIFKCDRCGKEQPTGDQMWNVGTCCAHVGVPSVSVGSRHLALWCRACCDAFALLRDLPPPKAGETPVPAPSLEDMLREIIRTVVDEEANP